MSNSDLIVSSFAGTLNPQDTQLTDSDKALLIKLLSNSAFFPGMFKSWLGNIMPQIMGELPISQVSGFLPIEKLVGFPGDAAKVLKGDGTWA